MKVKTMMIIKAVVCLVLGLPILVLPNLIYNIFGVTLDAGGQLTARQYGSSLIGILLITWFARNADQSKARWAIILGLLVYDFAGFVVSLIAVLTGVLNPLGWLVVVLYLLIALGFGWLLLKNPKP